MFEIFFYYLDQVDKLVWSYIGIPAIILLGFYLSYKSGWAQIVKFPHVLRVFFSFFSFKQDNKRGVHPLKTFFAGVGGSIGISNLIGVCTAVQVGGPGAVFWLWVASFIGMIVKYAEIYLGIKYRVVNKTGGYDGGPMYYLQQATAAWWVPSTAAILLCIYGADVYIFRTVTNSFISSWGMNSYVTVIAFITLILLGIEKGVERVGTISSIIIPIFLTIFIVAGMIILTTHASEMLGIIKLIFASAFTGSAAIGAFTGATVLMTISYGMKRACYAGDIGIGYASIIHSETEEEDPTKQATLGIFGIFLESFIISTMSMLLILVTGVWHQGFDASETMVKALGTTIPYVTNVWPIFIFLLGYSSLLTILTAGKKSAKFLAPQYGEVVYTVFAVCAFGVFSFFGTNEQLLSIMSLVGGLLLIINLYGMVKLVNNISFTFHHKNESKK